jgi:uncharacterized protein (TIGR02118 family)
MIRVAVLYPSSSGSTFDVNYYKNTHMKMVLEKLIPLGLLGCEVDAGIAGMDDAPPPYAAIGYMFFETLEAFQAGFARVGDELIADVPNYTNIEPVIQISDYAKL